MVYDVAPGLRAGRGLKQVGIIKLPDRLERSARPSGRARIETRPRAATRPGCAVAPGLRAGRGLKRLGAPRGLLGLTGSARPSGRARIETCSGSRAWPAVRRVAPGLRAGRGLKRDARRRDSAGRDRSARPSGRARIETCMPRGKLPSCSLGAPGLRAGRGLKRGSRYALGRRGLDPVRIAPPQAPFSHATAEAGLHHGGSPSRPTRRHPAARDAHRRPTPENPAAAA